MKLRFDVKRSQPDPFIFADGGRYYLYVTARDGAEVYETDRLLGTWHFRGIAASCPGGENYWAPSVIRLGDRYYMYVSFNTKEHGQQLYAARADSPLGPFEKFTLLYDRFSIDSHAVQTDAGLFLWYAEDNFQGERIGTRIYLDRLSDPFTPENLALETLVPTHREELFMADRPGVGRDWYTLEGPFWFRENGWQYLTYSGGCFMNESYHIGYASAPDTEEDLTKVKFTKHTLNGAFDPLMTKNGEEEGVGHHSVLRVNGRLYVVYHARDYAPELQGDARTARICRLEAENGFLRTLPMGENEDV